MSTSATPSPHPLANFAGSLLLVGAGKMGSALLEGWLALGLDPKKIVVLEPQPGKELIALAAGGLRLNPSADAVGEVSAIALAVKPQTAPAAMPALAPFVGASTVTLSIMAGPTLRFLEQALPPRAALASEASGQRGQPKSARAAVVRAMPNTPAAIGRGITVAVANARVSAAQRELVHALLSAVGVVEWVADEALMDAVTAVSGSGPAYVFLLAEAMARAGAAAGLPADLAARLARVTVAGAGELLHRSPLDAATLRQNVTSPGGTTAAALNVLMAQDGLEPLMTEAIAAATRRSRELAG
jgi:pyrroline-5-carboxylate reductase